MTDPGPLWHPAGLTRFDPAPRKLIYDTTPFIIPRAAFAIGNLVAKAAGVCDSGCQVLTKRHGDLNQLYWGPHLASLSEPWLLLACPVSGHDSGMRAVLMYGLLSSVGARPFREPAFPGATADEYEPGRWSSFERSGTIL